MCASECVCVCVCVFEWVIVMYYCVWTFTKFLIFLISSFSFVMCLMIVSCKTSGNLRSQKNFHGLKYIKSNIYLLIIVKETNSKQDKNTYPE